MSNKYAYINGVLLDGTRWMMPVSGKIVFTEGERIIAIGEDGDSTEGYEIIDLKGKFLLPGLINLHVHLPGTGKPKQTKGDLVKLVNFLTSNALTRKIVEKMCADAAKTQLMSGVTTIRTVGGVTNFDSIVRDKIYAGKLDGPRILASNAAISVPGGHMAGSVSYIAESLEVAVKLVDKIAASKPDLIKLMITGGVMDATKPGEPGELKMPAEYVKACCDRAHELGFKVAAHVESPEGLRVALENGVDTIEHGAMPDEELMRLFKEKGAAHVCTLSPALPMAVGDPKETGVSELAVLNTRVVLAGVIECAKKCLENDIPVGLGTDTGVPFVTHYDTWRELRHYSELCGVTHTFALYSATLGNAIIAGVDKDTGSIEVGKCADFIVTDTTPLLDFTSLRKPAMVVARGKIYKNPSVKRFAEVDAFLDKLMGIGK